MEISERIHNRMKSMSLRSIDVVKMAGVSRGTVSQWINGIAVPGGKNLLSLAKVLSCNPEWILTGKGAPEDLGNIGAGPKVTGHYPLISWVQAGDWNETENFHESDLVLYPCPTKCSASTFVLKVQGISMEPVFKDGDLIFVDPERQAEHNSYVVVRINGNNQATFKQLIVDNGINFLQPANKNWPEQIIKIKEDSTIVGVVIFAGRGF